LVNVSTFHRLMEARVTRSDSQPDPAFMDQIEQKVANLLREGKRLSGGSEEERVVAREVRRKLEAILRLPTIASRFPWSTTQEGKIAAQYIQENQEDIPSTWATLLSWLFVHALGKVVSQTDFIELSRSWMDEWRLGKTIASVLRDLGLEEEAAWKSVTLIKWLTSHQRWFVLKPSGQKPAYQVLESLLKDSEVHQYLQVNRYNDTLWFNKETFEELLRWLMRVAAVEISSDPQRSAHEVVKEMERCYRIIQTLKTAEKKSGYQIEKLVAAAREV
jgi:hypothetical protein